jgi:DNA-binding GntR family transcriptional regulator
LTNPRTALTDPHGLSLADTVVDWVTAAILAGRLVPGQKLIEADISATLGVSRGPVREALKRLEAQGVLSLSRHRGAYLRALGRIETIDLLVILEVLTQLMARLAAQAVANGRDASAVRKALAEFEAVDDVGRILQRRHFYDALMEVGENSQLASVLPLLRIHLLRLQVQPWFTPADIADRSAEYAAITAAVVAGDAAAAEASMRRHMRQMALRLVRLPDAAFPVH